MCGTSAVCGGPLVISRESCAEMYLLHRCTLGALHSLQPHLFGLLHRKISPFQQAIMHFDSSSVVQSAYSDQLSYPLLFLLLTTFVAFPFSLSKFQAACP